MQSIVLVVVEGSVALRSESEPGRFGDWGFRVRVLRALRRVDQNRRLLEATAPELEVGVGGGGELVLLRVRFLKR